jgi:hypothetical protein
MPCTQIPWEAFSAEYKLSRVVLWDRNGTQSDYRSNGTIVQWPGKVIGTHNFDFDQVSFWVDNPASDTTMPVLNSVHLREPGPFEAGQTVVIDIEAFDAQDVSSAYVNYTDPDGGYRLGGGLPWTNPTSISMRIGADWPQGMYTLKTFELGDSAPNTSWYRPDGTIFKDPSTATGPTTHNLDLNALSFMVDTPTLSVGEVTASEGGQSAVAAVTLSRPSDQTVSVRATTRSASAAAPHDYTWTTTMLTFAPGTLSQNLTVPIRDDALDESDETLDVVLSDATNAAIAPESTVTIVDNDPMPEVSISDVTVSEADRVAHFVVRLSTVSGRPVTFHFGAAHGSASAPTDYQWVGGTFTIYPGYLTRNINVPIVDDSRLEATEQFYVDLWAPSNAVLRDSHALGTIVDND